MANKTYKTPLVCKDVFLPLDVDDDELTIAQYKEKYGIDLSKYIYMDSASGILNFLFPENEKVYFVNLDVYHGMPAVSQLQWDDAKSSNWDEGNTNASQWFVCKSVSGNEYWGVAISVDKNDPFDLEHVVITYLTA